MLEIKNVEVFGLDRALKAAGNSYSIGEINTTGEAVDRDYSRGSKLGHCKTGSGHDCFLNGIKVYFDMKYSGYITPQLQRYHWFDIVSSQSKMHCLCKNAKDKDRFRESFNCYVDLDIIDRVNEYCNNYNAEKEKPAEERDSKKMYYWFMKAISNLPHGYELWMTVSTNYQQLKTMYSQRKGHPLKEDWGAFREMVEELPKFKELILEETS